jgi:hypothetical protein
MYIHPDKKRGRFLAWILLLLIILAALAVYAIVERPELVGQAIPPAPPE